MTIKKAKEELEAYTLNKKELNNRISEIRELEAQLYNGRAGRMDNAVCSLVILKDYCEEKVKEMKEELSNIDRKLSFIPQPCRSILYYYYIQEKSLTQIQYILHYDYTYISKLKAKGLKMYAEISTQLKNEREEKENGLA